MKNILACLLLGTMLLLICFSIYSQEAEQSSEALQNREEQWRLILEFGIDSEVTELVDTLREYTEKNLADAVLKRFDNSNNVKLQQAIIQYIRELKLEKGRVIIANIITNFAQFHDEVIIKALACAEELNYGSTEILTNIKAMLNDSDLQSYAISALGTLGDSAELETLLEYYTIYNDNTEIQADIILAIGNLRKTESMNFLLSIAENTTAASILRRYAIDSLAKSNPGNERVATLIQELTQNTEQWIRAYAVFALRFFPGKETETRVITALRDEFWRTRKFALETVATLNITAALDAVIYKAHNDPEKIVRENALNTLAALADKRARAELVNIAQKKAAGAAMRSLAINYLMDKPLSATEERAILNIIDEEWNYASSTIIKNISRNLPENKNNSIEKIVAQLLHYPDAGVQISSIKGIEKNNFSALKGDLEELIAETQNVLVRSYATDTLEFLTNTKEKQTTETVP